MKFLTEPPQPKKGFKVVTEKEFFGPIFDKKLNVHPSFENEYSPPYASTWKYLPANKTAYGRKVGYYLEGSGTLRTQYELLIEGEY